MDRTIWNYNEHSRSPIKSNRSTEVIHDDPIMARMMNAIIIITPSCIMRDCLHDNIHRDRSCTLVYPVPCLVDTGDTYTCMSAITYDCSWGLKRTSASNHETVVSLFVTSTNWMPLNTVTRESGDASNKIWKLLGSRLYRCWYQALYLNSLIVMQLDYSYCIRERECSIFKPWLLIVDIRGSLSGVLMNVWEWLFVKAVFYRIQCIFTSFYIFPSKYVKRLGIFFVKFDYF